MNTGMIILLCVSAVVILILLIFNMNSGNLNRIKAKKVGDGQHGTARWATPKEISDAFRVVSFRPDQWRVGKHMPTVDGLIIDKIQRGGKIYARVDTTDSHTLILSTTGGGKTTYFLYPNMEYACAAGMSFLVTDTKGDVFRDYATIAQKYYGYHPYVIDLRQPMQSDSYNLIHLVNKYYDLYNSTNNITYQAKAERYAKITAKTIVRLKGFDGGGQNAFFYDSAEGVIAAVILLIAEFCTAGQRHIVSVFKIVQELMQVDPTTAKNKESIPQTYLQVLLNKLPANHKAKWLAGAAANSPLQSMASVMSTAMSRLLSFIDSELEQIICFNSNIDAERFCTEKTAIFIVFPENDAPKHFIVSLFIKQLYNEVIEWANNSINNKLDKRVYFFLDEYGTMTKFEDAEMMFSAGRSRGIFQVPMIQSLSQLEKNYGKDGAEIIEDCCQNILFGGLSPLCSSAEKLSQSLGNQTIMSGSISHNFNHSRLSSGTSYQMIKRPLMTADELKNMEKGKWILEKTGFHPMQTTMDRFERWKIQMDDPYTLKTSAVQTVYYATRAELFENVQKKYGYTYTSIYEKKKELSNEYLY